MDHSVDTIQQPNQGTFITTWSELAGCNAVDRSNKGCAQKDPFCWSLSFDPSAGMLEEVNFACSYQVVCSNRQYLHTIRA